MPKPQVALIVGGGFSSEASLPTTPQLGRKFLHVPPRAVLREEVEQEISRQLTKFWNSVFHHRTGNRHPSLEDHFTVIDLAANTGHHIGPDYSPRKLRAIRRLSIHRVFQILDSSYQDSDAIEHLLRALKHSAHFSIVCVNWDIVAEKHLGKMTLAYDYGQVVEPLELGRNLRKAISLLKLHGSTNWTYCDSCRTLFSGRLEEGKQALHRLVFVEEDDFRLLGAPEQIVKLISRQEGHLRGCRRCGCKLTARVGTFSYRKDFAIQQFQTIWNRAHAALRDSEAWLFVGYSMPEADFEFRHLLKSAELAEKVSSRRRIQVVLKGDCDAGLRYRRFFGLNERLIYQGGLAAWVESCLEEWIQSTKDSR